MYVKKIYIRGFKQFQSFALELDPHLNIIVGDNETGKTTLLEAINLVLCGRHDGRNIQYELDPYVFNVDLVRSFFKTLRESRNASPPEVLIEAYLHDDGSASMAGLTGSHNSDRDDCPGVYVRIYPNSSFTDDLKKYVIDPTNPELLPTEYYCAEWRCFKGETMIGRRMPFRCTVIDTSLRKEYRGPNKYISQVIDSNLNEQQRQALSLAFKKLKQDFLKQDGIASINRHLHTAKGDITGKALTVGMDMSARSAWDNGVTAHLDDLPFDYVGKGEQCSVQMKVAINDASDSRVLLIEEPESHLSHSNMNRLIDAIATRRAGRQIVLTTHSAFVLNKLGLDKLKLLSSGGNAASLTELSTDTRDYFMKLPGYNTLRLILAKRSILVEGPSDELIVQKAYLSEHSKLPIDDGVDVITVGSLAFKRFLEIAKLLKTDVRVVTDNDGDVEALKAKYKEYLDDKSGKVRICYDEDVKFKTLEPQLLNANSLGTLNSILGTDHATNDMLLHYMEQNKTDCALKLFLTDKPLIAPSYIKNAIAAQ